MIMFIQNLFLGKVECTSDNNIELNNISLRSKQIIPLINLKHNRIILVYLWHIMDLDTTEM